MTEPKPRTVEMAKQEILEKLCSRTITGGGPDHLAYAQALETLDRCNGSDAQELVSLYSRLHAFVGDLSMEGKTSRVFAERLLVVMRGPK